MDTQSPEQALLEHLNQQAPGRLLLVASDCPPALQLWCEEHQCLLQRCAIDADPAAAGDNQRFDMAIVLAPTATATAQLAAGHQLGLLRNLYTSAIWLLVQEQQPAPRGNLLAQGFRRLQHFDSRELSSYGYNLASYNHQRSWNTPQYWANPENWGKYRW